MKKYFHILLTFATAILLASCSQESINPYEQIAGLAIKKIDSQTEYSPAAATGVIVVDTKESITASSDKDWCVVSVNANNVVLNLEANSGKLPRYAQITIKTASAMAEVAVVQYGEILGGLSSLSDVTASVEGDVVVIPVTLNVDVIFETTEDWIHPEGASDKLTITIDPNPAPRTRSGIVYYTAGSQKGSFEVVQYPELVQKEDWAVSLDNTTFTYPEFTAVTSVTVDAADMYVLHMIPKGTVTGDIQDYIFNDLAVSSRRQILTMMELAGGEFQDYLEKGSQTIDLDGVEVGDNYLIAIGFADNGYVTGQYQYAEVSIDDIRPDYYKWAGQWQMSGTYLDNSDYTEVITIAVDENDKDEDGKLKEARLIVYGLNSKAAEAWGAPENVNVIYLNYNSEDGSVTFYGQNTSTPFTRSSGEGWKLQLVSMYVKAGATAYTTGTGFNFLTATLDGTTGAKLQILERSAGLPWRVMRFRCLNAAGSAYTNTNANNASILLNDKLTMTRAN